MTGREEGEGHFWQMDQALARPELFKYTACSREHSTVTAGGRGVGRRAGEEGAVLRDRGWTALDVRLRLLNFPVVLEAPGKQRCGLVKRMY